MSSLPVFDAYHSMEGAALRRFLLLAASVALVELVGMACILGYMLHRLVTFLFATHPFDRFDALGELFIYNLPTLETFSALKVLRWCNPQLVFTMLSDRMSKPLWDSSRLVRLFGKTG